MKTYGFDINPSVIYYNSSIRDKFTIIKLLIGISNFLNMSKPQLLSELSKDFSSEKIRLIIYIDKMSRIFIEEKEKICEMLKKTEQDKINRLKELGAPEIIIKHEQEPAICNYGIIITCSVWLGLLPCP